MIRLCLLASASLALSGTAAAQTGTASDLPVRIVEVPKPLPLPGQLQRVQRHKGKGKPIAPAARVSVANRSATREPVAAGYINAMQVYPFAEGALYRLYAAPERITDIALQPGETLVAIAAGDTARWTVGDTTSGSGATRRTHILVKPFTAGLDTNLVITTDRRSYHLQLESTPGTAMAALSWSYPADELIALRRDAAAEERAAPVAAGVPIESLHFDYRISGDQPRWRPIRAFDDPRIHPAEFLARRRSVGSEEPRCPADHRGSSRLAADGDRAQGSRLAALEGAVIMVLRLPKLPDRNPVKLPISLTPDLHQALTEYAALYAETYGQAESVQDLIPFMLQGFLDSDRAFKTRPKGAG